MKIIFASGNKGKVREVKNIFRDTKFEIVSLHDLDDVPEIIEDADTFEGNAKIKAEVIFDKYKIPVIADDSGIAVEQLNWAPGVISARYAGEICDDEANNKKLISELKKFPQPHFGKFICCAIYLDEKNYFCEFGEVPGNIIYEPRGKNGFGYDPIFVPIGYEITLGEFSLEEKNKISHRSRAFNKLKEHMLRVV